MLRKKLKLDPLENPNDPNLEVETPENLPDKMMTFQKELNGELGKISFIKHPVYYVYNPTEYASDPCEKYLQKYCRKTKKIMFVGMNPGPFGMCQTGVPFGEINSVKNWLQITGEVGQPESICPKRKIEGFSCNQFEKSGLKFWNFFKDLCKSPEYFFENAFVYNYCPLAFMKEGGQNVTPENLESSLRKLLENHCDQTLSRIIQLLKPEVVVGVGKYSEKRANIVLENSQLKNVQVFYLIHPSPIIPNNDNWGEKARKFLDDTGLIRYFQNARSAL